MPVSHGITLAIGDCVWKKELYCERTSKIKKLQIYVNDKLWVFDVSDTEFLAVIIGSKFNGTMRHPCLFTASTHEHVWTAMVACDLFHFFMRMEKRNEPIVTSCVLCGPCVKWNASYNLCFTTQLWPLIIVFYLHLFSDNSHL